MAEREKWYAALGYFTLLVLRRWRRWASCSAATRAALHAVLLRRSMLHALRLWKRTCRLMQLTAGLVVIAKKSTLRRWQQLVQRQRACEHADAALLQRCWRGWLELWLSRARLKVGMKGHAMLRMVRTNQLILIITPHSQLNVATCILSLLHELGAAVNGLIVCNSSTTLCASDIY
jgi:hypothetical protein